MPSKKPTSQMAWLRAAGIIDDPSRKPAPVKPKSPQQRAAATRRRRRAAARQPKPYTPSMSAEGRPTSRSLAGRTLGGPTSPLRTPAPRTPAPKTPVWQRVDIPKPRTASTASAGARINTASGSYAGPPPVPGKEYVGGVRKSSKIWGRIPKVARVGGAIGTGLTVAAIAKGASDSVRGPSKIVVGPASNKVAREFSPSTALAMQDLERSPSEAAYNRAASEAYKAKSKASTSVPSPAKRTGPKAGKFVTRATAHNRMRERIGMDSGKNYFRDKAESGVRKKFLETHKWARKAKTKQQKTDLNEAVKFLAASGHRAYF